MSPKKTNSKRNEKSIKLKEKSENIDQISPGRVIRERRKLLGMKEINLARLAKMNPRTLDAIEKGRIRSPSIDSLNVLTKILGISMASLFSNGKTVDKSVFHAGNQKGHHTLEFPNKGFRIVSYTPLIPDFFVGKVILGGDVKIGPDALPTSGMIFVQAILGKLVVNFEGTDHLIKEGTYVFFDGRFAHSYHNPQPKENTFLLVTCPSFLTRS